MLSVLNLKENTTMQYSKRVLELKDSPLRKLTPLIDEQKRKGKSFIHFNIGQPDLETPACFFEAIRNYSNHNVPYAPSLGIAPLIEAIQDTFKNKRSAFKKKRLLSRQDLQKPSSLS
jgi:aspartate aminotransferase